MAAKKIFTIGLVLPGGNFEYVPFNSDQTLLDADIAVFEPKFGSVSYDYDGYQGYPLLDKSSSVRVEKALAHWKAEMVAAANAGKLVVIFMKRPESVYRHTGQTTYSGTGRSQKATNIVAPCSTYDAVPVIKSVVGKTGSATNLTTDAAVLKPYWSEFSDWSPYEAEFDAGDGKVILTSKSGSRTVGAICLTKSGGALLFVPPLSFNDSKFKYKRDEREYWNKEGQAFGAKVGSHLAGIADQIRKTSSASPPPVWANDPQFQSVAEQNVLGEIERISERIIELGKEKATLEGDLEKSRSLRGLIYEQGRSLESCVVEAMNLFGFAAESYAEGDSEFDVVFASSEGRCLGEVEGKDAKAVNIDKFSQLERNLNEDFAREEVTEYAKGVLFGNAFRLLPLEERAVFFTDKCLSAAKRVGVALVRTPDLFFAARYLKDNRADAAFAQACREAILNTSGEIVTFPKIPE